MIQVNAMGDACPIPVVKTKNAIRDLAGAGVVETLVDNEIAVQNLTKMANQKGYGVKSEKAGRKPVQSDHDHRRRRPCAPRGRGGSLPCRARSEEENRGSHRFFQNGEGDEELGKTLMKGFIYALGQQEILPETILFYNGGAALSCEGSPALEDLKSLEAQGVEILTCGTCLDFYNLKEKLRVGDVTNMYVIVEKMMEAHQIVKP